jgi:hypothetical protein
MHTAFPNLNQTNTSHANTGGVGVGDGVGSGVGSGVGEAVVTVVDVHGPTHVVMVVDVMVLVVKLKVGTPVVAPQKLRSHRLQEKNCQKHKTREALA